MKKSKSEKTPTSKKNASTKEVADDLSHKPAPEEFLVVGIGASAGGIQALKEFFDNVPADSGMAYVVILHLSPDHDSRLAEVLQHSTVMPVSQVTKKVIIEPNHVYVVPPNEHLEIFDGHIVVSTNVTVEDRRAPVDIFFRTLAESHHARAVAVILSGTGANGSMGIKRIKERGGAAFVQNPREAEFSEMPRNSIATDLIDRVLNVAEIPAHIIAYKQSLGTIEIPIEAETRPENQQQALLEILTQLRLRTGHDFSNYKRATILRRIERRINVRGLEDLPAYSAYVSANPDEATALLKDLLISVTNFFRDKESFNFLETNVIPKIFARKTSEDQVRIWVAGCATGEEAYSLAMLCSEITQGLIDAPQVQIFASDIDEQAIAKAREGYYTLNDAADVSPERLRRFFTKETDGYRIRRELRELILFAHHNVLKDPPFSHLDAITCRNLLIYLNRAAQDRVMETFHFALESGSYLFLGNSETAEGKSDLYGTVSKDHHIYQSRHVFGRIVYPVADSMPPSFRFDRKNNIQALLAPAQQPESDARSIERVSYGGLHLRLLEQYTSSILINEHYDIVHISGNAARFLQIKAGEPTQSILKLIVPDLRLELRTALYQAAERQTNVEVQNLNISHGEHQENIHLHVRPVTQENDETARGFVLVLFETAREGDNGGKTRQAVFSSTEPMVSQLEAELVRSQSRLRQTVEQFEVQAEELKASNEELQAMNEEQRSAAEELETSKEELQSVNEELITVNQELKVKIDELSQSTGDFSNLINSTDVATIFLDRTFRVHTFTPAASRIFNLIPADFGRPISDITHRLEQDGLIHDAETVLENLQTIEREARSTDGRTYLMRVLPYRTEEDRINGVVATFLDITERKRAEEAVRYSEERLQRAINIETVGVIFFNNEIEITDCNEAFLRMSGFTRNEIKAGRFSWEMFTPEEFIEPSQKAIRELNTRGFSTPYEKEYIRKDGTRFWALFACKRIGENEIVEFVTDITEQKRAEVAVRRSEVKYRDLFDSMDEGYCIIEIMFDHFGKPNDWRFVEVNPAFEKNNGLSGATGKTILELTPDIEPKWFDIYGRIAVTGIPLRFEEHSVAFNRWFSLYAFRVGEPEENKVAVIFNDISERKRREANLAFIADVSQDLVRLSNVDEMMGILGAKIGEHLNLARCVFVEVFESENRAVFIRDWCRPEFSGIVGEIPISQFVSEEYRSKSRAEEIIIVPDIHQSQLVDGRQVEEVFGITSLVSVPLLREGVWKFTLSIYDSVPRDWRGDEIELIREITSRIWTRLERARAEEALARSEEKYRTLFDSIDEGFSIVEVIQDEAGKVIDFRYQEVNRAYEQQTGLHNVVGRLISEVMPQMETYWMEQFDHVVRTGEPSRIENYNVDTKRWYQANHTRVGGAGSRLVGTVFDEITGRKRHEANLAFLAETSADFAPLLSAEELMERVGNRLGDFLGLSRCNFSVVDEAADHIECIYDWRRDESMPSILGSHLVSDFLNDAGIKYYAAGKISVVSDTRDSPMLGGSFESIDALGIRSVVDAPSLNNGRWEFLLSAARSEAGEWREDEVTLIHELAERIYIRIERARVEDALRESEGRLRALVENLPGGAVFIVDKNLRYLLAQGEALTDAGFKPEDLIGCTIGEAMPAKLAESYEPLYRLGLQGESFELEHQAHNRTFMTRGVPLIGTNGDIYAVLAISYDITRRKRAEEALAESEERLRLLIESASDYAIFTSTPDNLIDSWNTGAEKIFGWTEEEVLGKSGEMIFTPEDRAKGAPQQEIKTALKKGRAPDERFHLRKDGSRFYVSGVTTPLKDSMGKFQGFVKIARDMTEQIAAQKARRDKETLQILVGAQETERKRIALDLHDELGQQLTALRLKLESARKLCADHVELCSRIEEIELLAKSIDNGIDFIAWELRPAVLDQLGLVAALNNYVNQWSNHSGINAELITSNLKKARFTTEIETNLYRIVQEALNNIHKHAKATRAEVVIEKRDSLIVLLIEDDGKGFNPLDKNNKAKGIGLIGMKERAQLIGGMLEIESSPDKGTTIYVRVPTAIIGRKGSDEK